MSSSIKNKNNRTVAHLLQSYRQSGAPRSKKHAVKTLDTWRLDYINSILDTGAIMEIWCKSVKC